MHWQSLSAVFCVHLLLKCHLVCDSWRTSCWTSLGTSNLQILVFVKKTSSTIQQQARFVEHQNTWHLRLATLLYIPDRFYCVSNVILSRYTNLFILFGIKMRVFQLKYILLPVIKAMWASHVVGQIWSPRAMYRSTFLLLSSSWKFQSFNKCPSSWVLQTLSSYYLSIHSHPVVYIVSNTVAWKWCVCRKDATMTSSPVGFVLDYHVSNSLLVSSVNIMTTVNA